MNEAETAVPRARDEINLTEKNLRNFWRKVNKDGPTMPRMETPCWVWTARKNQHDYGTIKIARISFLAHRASWIIANGTIPEGMCVCHRCDNPACIRFDHLFLGTPADNVHDRDLKGRGNQPRGELQGRSKLTSFDVIEIRSLRKNQKTLGLIANLFGVGTSTIHRICAGKSWNHIL